jgi:hypothetical protein
MRQPRAGRGRIDLAMRSIGSAIRVRFHRGGANEVKTTRAASWAVGRWF